MELRMVSNYIDDSNVLYVCLNTQQHVYDSEVQAPKKRIAAFCLVKDYGVNVTDELIKNWIRVKGRKPRYTVNKHVGLKNKIRILVLCAHQVFKGRGRHLLDHVLRDYKQKSYEAVFIESLLHPKVLSIYTSFGFKPSTNKLEYTESSEDETTYQLECVLSELH